MTVIWKFQIGVADALLVPMPKGAKLLTVQVKNGATCLWALVDPKAPKASRKISTYGTGHEHDAIPGVYVGVIISLTRDAVNPTLGGNQ